MFSGGLDSVITAHLLKSLGLDVHALHFVLPFDAGLGKTHASIRRRAEVIGVPLSIIEETDSFLEVLKEPSFGFGKNANPCIDCRIHRLIVAAGVMRERGAKFIATGEVLGQRPMSQRYDAMRSIEKRAGLSGLLLRPLSAHHLEPTIPEQEGMVDRSRLMGIKGRGRKEQLAYATAHGLEYGTPGGGCILTNEMTANRYEDLVAHDPQYPFEDLRLIAWGRRFRLSPSAVVHVGRDEAENVVLEKIRLASDTSFQLVDHAGPYAIARGMVGAADRELCAQIVVRYSTKASAEERARVLVQWPEGEATIDAVPVPREVCDQLRI